ncbi:MAG TPA: (2Fe-2S) ferredoxin domain-containing protein [Thermoanaerobaculia bacterium]
MNYPFDKLFLVCAGKRCRGEAIQEELKALNKQLGRKPDVRVVQVSCLDLCDHGPNMVVQPGGAVYSHLDHLTAAEVYLGEMGDGPRRDDLLLSEEEFRAGSSAAALTSRLPKL